ncbi:hypothetical protein [Nocardia lijiangensis]|uniref:hypothetical protein n=1 Tax=Nocardia lijiangensis TaxID=299618 RepID=UPI00082D8B36|nr:hypothetical protein [Nocardia lijiangensis]
MTWISVTQVYDLSRNANSVAVDAPGSGVQAVTCGALAENVLFLTSLKVSIAEHPAGESRFVGEYQVGAHRPTVRTPAFTGRFELSAA